MAEKQSLFDLWLQYLFFLKICNQLIVKKKQVKFEITMGDKKVCLNKILLFLPSFLEENLRWVLA